MKKMLGVIVVTLVFLALLPVQTFAFGCYCTLTRDSSGNYGYVYTAGESENAWSVSGSSSYDMTLTRDSSGNYNYVYTQSGSAEPIDIHRDTVVYTHEQDYTSQLDAKLEMKLSKNKKTLSVYLIDAVGIKSCDLRLYLPDGVKITYQYDGAGLTALSRVRQQHFTAFNDYDNKIAFAFYDHLLDHFEYEEAAYEADVDPDTSYDPVRFEAFCFDLEGAESIDEPDIGISGQFSAPDGNGIFSVSLPNCNGPQAEEQPGKPEPPAPEKKPRRGDADGDDKITANDARTALRVAVSLDTVSDETKTLIDIDGNGEISAGDARSILRAAVGLESL